MKCLRRDGDSLSARERAGAVSPQLIWIRRDRSLQKDIYSPALLVPSSGLRPPFPAIDLELLRRSGIIDALPEVNEIHLEGREQAQARGAKLIGTGRAIGVSPGAAYGTAKRWLPERFAEAASSIAAKIGASILVFGSNAEKELCAQVASLSGGRNLAGTTTLREFIDMTAACSVYLSNDSGAMHLAAALGVPSVTVFGPTDETATGPVAANASLLRQTVECSPCLKRECPIDHRCMTRVSAEMVAAEAIRLVSAE